ncbi:hypothetical protein Y032_0048g1680 [Ancylostoma ceylanicum]|nr:hypothetical protein Y032_0048g1680 [Ancylostoma ceylanicum]
MDWPACSLDCNPVENIWGLIVRQVYRNNKQYNTVDTLRTAILEAWDEMDDDTILNLVRSTCSVLSDVIFVFGATKTGQSKDDTSVFEFMQIRLGLACYLHMLASCLFVMALLTAIASSYMLISSGKGREGCCQSRKDYLQQYRWNHDARTVFACSRKSCRPIVVIEDDSM